MWKFKNFSDSQILREINCGNFEVIKLHKFETYNLDEVDFNSQKIAKILRKIWVAEKSLNFHTLWLLIYIIHATLTFLLWEGLSKFVFTNFLLLF